MKMHYFAVDNKTITDTKLSPCAAHWQIALSIHSNCITVPGHHVNTGHHPQCILLLSEDWATATAQCLIKFGYVVRYASSRQTDRERLTDMLIIILCSLIRQKWKTRTVGDIQRLGSGPFSPLMVGKVVKHLATYSQRCYFRTSKGTNTGTNKSS